MEEQKERQIFETYYNRVVIVISILLATFLFFLFWFFIILSKPAQHGWFGLPAYTDDPSFWHWNGGYLAFIMATGFVVWFIKRFSGKDI